jgi:hypothetical protein
MAHTYQHRLTGEISGLKVANQRYEGPDPNQALAGRMQPNLLCGLKNGWCSDYCRECGEHMFEEREEGDN